MPNKRNLQLTDELEERFRHSSTVFLTDYRGLKVSDLAALRRQLREVGVDYRVAKNTLTRIASERAGVTGLAPLLAGPTAVAFVSGDAPASARALLDFARVSRIMTVKGGFLGTHVLSADDVAEVSRLPAKSQLQADLVGSVQGPLASVIGVLNGALSGIVHALEERSKQLQPA
jgi:large subunit ribosomal protein L10